MKPEYTEAYQELGYAYLNIGTYNEAVASFREAIRIKPDYALAHFNLGITYVNMSDRTRAMEQYRILQRMDRARADKLLAAINK